MDFLKVDLTAQYKGTYIEGQFAEYKKKVIGFTDVNEEHNLKTGDTITFMGGYNNDIEFTSEILGFDKDGDAFVWWDCYWFPVRLSDRLVKNPQ